MKQAKKPAAGEKMLAFTLQFSNFRDSCFNHVKTVFCNGSIKLSIFNAKLYMDLLQALSFSHEKLYIIHYLHSLKFLKSINKSILEKKFVNYFTLKKISLDER